MKKILMSMVLAVASLAASAQVYVGGSANLWRDYDANKTTFSLIPEVGYKLSDKWDIGVTLGYDYKYNNSVKTNSFKVEPYARYTFASWDNVSLFCDVAAGIGSSKTTVDDNSSDAYTTWSAGFRPGVAVNLTSKLSFIAHLGFLGYKDEDSALGAQRYEIESFGGQNGIGFDLKNNVNFGLFYNF